MIIIGVYSLLHNIIIYYNNRKSEIILFEVYHGWRLEIFESV